MRTPQAMTAAEKRGLETLVITLAENYVNEHDEVKEMYINVSAGRNGLEINVSCTIEEFPGCNLYELNPHFPHNTTLRHAIKAALDAGVCVLDPANAAGHHESLAGHPSSGPLKLFRTVTTGNISSHMRLQALAVKSRILSWVKTTPVSSDGLEYFLEGLA